MSSHPPSSPPSSVVRFPSSQRIVENWKWKGAILTIYMTCIINGFDVSNVANIQPQLYVAFGHIEYLPWIGLSYSLANFATLSFAGRILDIFDIRHIYLASIVVFAAGAALAGSAKTISAIIAGRAVMGIGGSICQNCQGPFLYGILSSLWAVGLVIGGPVGSALAEKVTWRWAFYINLPFLGFAFHHGSHNCSLCYCGYFFWSRVELELSALLHNMGCFAAVFVLCGTLHCTRFTAAIKDRLHTSFKSVPDRRVIPIELMGRRNILPLWIVSGCAGATYAVTLYYLPLFYAFSKGHGALQQTIRMLPFILTFIVTVLIVGAFLSKIKQYGVIYVVGGATTLASGTSLAIILDSDVSESKVMGLTALIGIGLGFQFQHGNAISNTINKTLRDRVESAALLNMSLMGGISTALIMAGAIYENRGMALLPSTLEPFHYDDKTIREALAGVSPTVWEGAETNITAYGADATTQAISSLLYIISSSGALCLFCGALILWDMKLKRGYRENAVATV
ncbi:hypothetical protein FOXB_03246 [Fusarium oxysporum f. sp. conglutinans Fo5176]|uniref:Major facilitator superfamily (MFS) profile domain-containing protein n=1 Tax=Fusarium oxysporum (strain Fo5176) TaxID=660025 RepID=F9FA21_FUSOF|nr:hypothetical protein FOXB_03246 [Fusarium oxysporum f. sp. conglutinans Fo5176]